MHPISQAALVGALTGALASAPATYLALRLTRKTSNVLLLADGDAAKLQARLGQQMGPHGPGCTCEPPKDGSTEVPITGQYL